MEDYLNKIAKIIKDSALDEDKYLKELCGKGIFWMPELAFAYMVGKKLIVEKSTLFQNQNVEWIRETTLDGYGRSIFDLVIRIDSYTPVIISFKMNSNQDNYVKDIEILNAVDPTRFKKLFCSLKLCNEMEKEDFYIENSTNNSSKMIESRLTSVSFETWWPNIDWKSFCQLGVWQIK